jgi:isocitrate/isopropylmalate dehydrogenase
MIGSVAFMLEKSFGLHEEAQSVWSALFAVFGKGYRTTELKTPGTPPEKVVSTEQFGDLVVSQIRIQS